MVEICAISSEDSSGKWHDSQMLENCGEHVNISIWFNANDVIFKMVC